MKKIKKTIISLIVLCFMFNISFAASYEMHTVKEGDTYWTISQNYNTNYYQIINLNNANTDVLFPGELIKVKTLSKNISVYVNNIKLQSDVNPYIENNRTFLPIRTIAEALGANVSWDGKNKIAIIEKDNIIIKLPIGSNNAFVNNEQFILDAPIQLYQNRTLVPVRFISEILNAKVSWDQNSYSVLINSSLSNISQQNSYNSTINDDEIYWLSRIVEAEAQGESYEGKLAVANVVINRKNSSNFPNTIYGVIFEKSYGYYQFTPVKNGTIYNNPSYDSILAATNALNGKNNVSNALYFLNPDKATQNWIVKTKTFITSIGNHDFYL